MFQITSYYQSENISDWCVFILASDWFQTGFISAQRISDCVFRFQIASDSFQTGSLKEKIQTGSLKKNFRLVV